MLIVAYRHAIFLQSLVIFLFYNSIFPLSQKLLDHAKVIKLGSDDYNMAKFEYISIQQDILWMEEK